MDFFNAGGDMGGQLGAAAAQNNVQQNMMGGSDPFSGDPFAANQNATNIDTS